MSIRVVFVDDHEVVRQGMAAIARGTEIELVGSAGNGEEFLRMVDDLKPDVALIDVRMRDEDGLSILEALRRKHEKLPVVMISTYNNPPTSLVRSPKGPPITCSRDRLLPNFLMRSAGLQGPSRRLRQVFSMKCRRPWRERRSGGGSTGKCL